MMQKNLMPQLPIRRISFTTEKEKSDVVHDFLAFLAEQMIDLNKQKQAEIKSFHTWLETYLGIKIDEMKVKTQVRAFYDRSFDEYYKVLKRSKGKLELKIEGKDAHDKIKEAFDGTTSKLTPLFDGIRGTDGLIDQIVYRLYGLMEEEIKVVEGNGGRKNEI